MTDVKLLLTMRNGRYLSFLGWLAGNGNLVCLGMMIGVEFLAQGLAMFEGVILGILMTQKCLQVLLIHKLARLRQIMEILVFKCSAQR